MKWYERSHNMICDENNIKGFFGEHRWLSNYEPCLVEYEGLVFLSSEAAFQAAKCENKEERSKFLNVSASEAKKLGQTVLLRGDWEIVKIPIMEEVLWSKFSKVSYLRQNLLLTENKFLEETNWWGDIFWGVCKGKGENILGKLLMKIRKQLHEDNY